MRLIDADKLNARISRDGTPYFTVCDIENAPTVDVVQTDVVSIDKYKEVCEQLDFMTSRCKRLEKCLIKSSFGYASDTCE